METIKIGVSTRALFNLEYEHNIFIENGIEAYRQYQLEHKNVILEPGIAFGLIKNVLALNDLDNVNVQVILMSRACPDIATRILKSCNHYGLNINHALFTGGDSLKGYAESAELDLYLSANEGDVKAVLDCGIAAGLVRPNGKVYDHNGNEFRVAFDCDRVLFGSESDEYYAQYGLEEYVKNEKNLAHKPIEDGPFKKLLVKLGHIQQFTDRVKIAICTARGFECHERCLTTLRSWGVTVSQAFFLAGENKAIALKGFGADVFFDDGIKNVDNASEAVASCLVPQGDCVIL